MSEKIAWAEKHRDYLRLLGLAQLAGEVRAKIDLSGVIQVTMLEASQQEPPNLNANQQLPWLRRVFLNNLLDELRKLRAQRRDIQRERSLEEPIEQSATRLKKYLAGDESSPSVKAIRQERADLLLQAIAELPEAQRTAIELHHLQELPLEEISKRLDRPKGAVAALIYRGMKTLRAKLDSGDDSVPGPWPDPKE